MNIVFMGTPDFAVPTLQALCDGPHFVSAVFCQPDRPKGRGKKLQMPPVKEAALAHDIPVYQPLKLDTEDVKETLRALNPDCIVVVAYGKILPNWLLELPVHGCINVHASLLPKFRGAAPIQFSLLEGESKTGVTIMQITEGLDEGPGLMVKEYAIKDGDTAGDLFNILGDLGASCINEALEGLANGSLVPQPQDDALATYTKKITKDMGAIDWSQSAVDIHNRIRALTPSPGAYSFLEGKRLKIYTTAHKAMNPAAFTGIKEGGSVGEIVAKDKQTFFVQTGDGLLQVTEVQPENKKRMAVSSFLCGMADIVGHGFAQGAED